MYHSRYYTVYVCGGSKLASLSVSWSPRPACLLTGTPPKLPGSPLSAHSLHELSHTHIHTHIPTHTRSRCVSERTVCRGLLFSSPLPRLPKKRLVWFRRLRRASSWQSFGETAEGGEVKEGGGGGGGGKGRRWCQKKWVFSLSVCLETLPCVRRPSPRWCGGGISCVSSAAWWFFCKLGRVNEVFSVWRSRVYVCMCARGGCSFTLAGGILLLCHRKFGDCTRRL